MSSVVYQAGETPFLDAPSVPGNATVGVLDRITRSRIGVALLVFLVARALVITLVLAARLCYVGCRPRKAKKA